MNRIIKLLSIVVIVSSATACAPTKDESVGNVPINEAPQSSGANQISNTSDLIANPDFDFRNDRDISLAFSSFPSELGKFVIYHAYEHFEPETKTYYPDHTSRVASYVANTNITYTFQSLKEWQYLVFEWLPMDGRSNEQYMLVALSDDNEYTLSF